MRRRMRKKMNYCCYWTSCYYCYLMRRRTRMTMRRRTMTMRMTTRRMMTMNFKTVG